MMRDPFNPDLYKQRDTKKDQERIERDKEEFLANGGKIKVLSSGVSSGVCDLPPQQIKEIKKKLGVPANGGEK